MKFTLFPLFPFPSLSSYTYPFLYLFIRLPQKHSTRSTISWKFGRKLDSCCQQSIIDFLKNGCIFSFKAGLRWNWVTLIINSIEEGNAFSSCFPLVLDSWRKGKAGKQWILEVLPGAWPKDRQPRFRNRQYLKRVDRVNSNLKQESRYVCILVTKGHIVLLYLVILQIPFCWKNGVDKIIFRLG